MKLSEISPVYKKNDPLSKENYCSVNLLTMFSKFFERLLSDQLTEYFLTILSPNLSAYRKGYSCQHVILKLTEFWRSALDENKFVGTISTDLSKAFDKMPHGLLIAKLHAYGLSPDACRLAMSYLCNRMQRVKISGITSEWATINRGVPQGSVLGPLLFNIFLNDLFYVEMSAEIANYADDNNLTDCHNSLDTLTLNLANDTEKAISWYNKNSLDANAEKFQSIFMDRNGTVNTCLPVHGSDLQSCDNIKVLGVTLDSKMSFTPHINSICTRASRQINALRRLSRFLNTETRLSIYKSFIFANFTYSPVPWLFCGIKNSLKLEKLQERAIRFVYNDYSSPYKDLLSQANLLPLSIYRLRFMAIEVYKCFHDLNPAYVNEMFTYRDTTYGLRDTLLLEQPKFDTYTFGYKSFKYYGSKVWNALPPDIKNSENLFIFKREITKWCHTTKAATLATLKVEK